MIDFIKHIEYQRWANRKIAEHIKPLYKEITEKELGGSFPSLRLTLLHLLQADYRWLHRLKGNPIVDVPPAWSSDHTDALLTIWLSVQDELVDQVKTLAPNGDQDIHFTTAKGDRYVLPLSEVLIHLVNHSTHHRGQLVNMLRMVGETPPGTDYFLFSVAQRK